MTLVEAELLNGFYVDTLDMNELLETTPLLKKIENIDAKVIFYFDSVIFKKKTIQKIQIYLF